MKIDLFGKIIKVEKSQEGWKAFYLSPDGKKRPADDLVIPRSIRENEIKSYLEDLCHEMAKAPEIRIDKTVL